MLESIWRDAPLSYAKSGHPVPCSSGVKSCASSNDTLLVRQNRATTMQLSMQRHAVGVESLLLGQPRATRRARPITETASKTAS